MRVLLVFLFTFLVVLPLHATTISGTFQCLKDPPNTPECSFVGGQLTMDVTVDSPDVLSFTLTNGLLNEPLSGFPSSVTAIYWLDLGGLMGTPGSISGTGVTMSSGCMPGNLPDKPGGWPSNRDYSGPCVGVPRGTGDVPAAGVNVGETVTIGFVPPLGFDPGAVLDGLTDFNLATGQGIGVGIHVQSINGGSSDAMILIFGSSDVPDVPEPATLVIIGSGLAMLGLLRWRRQ